MQAFLDIQIQTFEKKPTSNIDSSSFHYAMDSIIIYKVFGGDHWLSQRWQSEVRAYIDGEQSLHSVIGISLIISRIDVDQNLFW